MSMGTIFIQGQQGPLQPDDLVIETLFRIRDHQGKSLVESHQARRLAGALGAKLSEKLLDQIEDAYHLHGSMPAAMNAARFVEEKLLEANRARALNPSFKASEKWQESVHPGRAGDSVQRPGSYYPESGILDPGANRAERWSHGLESDYGRFRSIPPRSPESSPA